jgi:hypothetical protein
METQVVKLVVEARVVSESNAEGRRKLAQTLTAGVPGFPPGSIWVDEEQLDVQGVPRADNQR